MNNVKINESNVSCSICLDCSWLDAEPWLRLYCHTGIARLRQQAFYLTGENNRISMTHIYPIGIDLKRIGFKRSRLNKESNRW